MGDVKLGENVPSSFRGSNRLSFMALAGLHFFNKMAFGSVVEQQPYKLCVVGSISTMPIKALILRFKSFCYFILTFYRKGEEMLTENEIQRFMQDLDGSNWKAQAKVGQKYYDAEHDILSARMFYYNADGQLVEDTIRSNVKICHPFFTELADQIAAYMLSFKEFPFTAKETAEGLQEYLEEYFDDDFWAECNDLITGAYTKGSEYIYAYKNEDEKTAFMCADSLGVVEVKAMDATDGKDHIIYCYSDTADLGKKKVKKIQVWDVEEVYYYVQENDGKLEKDTTAEYNPRPHTIITDGQTGEKLGYSFGFLPFFRLDNNRKRLSGLKPIKNLIDDYDLMECGLSNNLTDFDTPLHVVSGFEGDNLDELQQNLKTKKIVGVDVEGDVQIRTVDVPYQARKTKADEDKENIYKFGMGFNSSQIGDGNITNIVIRSRYALLDLKAKKLEKQLKKLLKELLKIVIAEINADNSTDYKVSDVKIDFEHSIMTNESENITNAKVEAETKQIEVNTVLNVAMQAGEEQTLKAICDIMDWNFEELQSKVEAAKKEQEQQTAQAARQALGGVTLEENPTENIEPNNNEGGGMA